MSKKKTIFGIFLILLTLSLMFMINIIPTFFGSNLSKFETKIDIDLDFLENEKKTIIMVFFGYVGCVDICIPSLKQIDKIYSKINKEKVSVYFVNLLTTAEKNSVDDYAKMFNKDFKGVYLNKAQINKIISQLNVIYRPSLTDNSVIDHSGFLHLFIKKDNSFTQKYVYTSNPLDMEFIATDINNLIKKGEF